MTSGEYAARPLSGVRGAIAARMVASLQTAAQLTFHADCDASALLAARKAVGDGAAKVGVEDLLIAALAQTAAHHPEINGLIVDREIRLYPAIRIGVAIALPAGLMAPALPDVRDATLTQIASWRADLLNRARAGALLPAEMTRGTITITNLGHRGVRYFTPVLNTPQIAILGIGAIAPRLSLEADGTVVNRPILPLSLTVDHRAIDGDPAGHFLADLRSRIELGAV